jgi:hypothetical protein
MGKGEFPRLIGSFLFPITSSADTAMHFIGIHYNDGRNGGGGYRSART